MGDVTIEGGSWRFVELGRVVVLSAGPDAGKLGAIVEIIDHKRVRSSPRPPSIPTKVLTQSKTGPRRRPLLRFQARPLPPRAPPLQRSPHQHRHPEAAPRRAHRNPPVGVGEGRGRQAVDRQQLGQEEAAAGAQEGPVRLRPLQGHAPQEAEAVRGAQGVGEDQGLRISSVKERTWWMDGVASGFAASVLVLRFLRGQGKARQDGFFVCLGSELASKYGIRVAAVPLLLRKILYVTSFMVTGRQ